MDDMNRKITLGFALSLVIVVFLFIYGLNEGSRLESAAAQNEAGRVVRGREQYGENCAVCHGPQGQGVAYLGPVLNSQAYLKAADDRTIFDAISDGRPNTAMPAWGQEHGGLFTIEKMADLVAFIRSWEATAPIEPTLAVEADPVQGAVWFSTICFACHGINGEGTNHAPALNSPELLVRRDDEYFRETIAGGAA